MAILLARTALIAFLATSLAYAQTPKVALDSTQTQESADLLFKTIKDALRTSNGNLDGQNFKLVLAFSTGHFAQDPGMAEAARALSSSLVERHLIAGDEVSAYAWEMNLWEHPGATGNPYRLEADKPSDSTKATVNALWPRSPQPDSVGGHDTEKAIAQLSERLSNAPDTVLVLLTNTAYSVASSHEQPVGDSYAGFNTALEHFKKLPARTSSGASLALPFKELTTGRERSLDAVILVPITFSGTALSSGTRTERLAAVLTTALSSSFPWWMVGVGLLVVAGLAALGLRRRPSPTSGPSRAPARAPVAAIKSKGGKDWNLEIEGRNLALPAKGEVCRLYRAGHRTSDERAVSLSETNIPLLLCTLERTATGLEVRLDEKTRLLSINGQPVSKPLFALAEGPVRLKFKGSYQARAGLPDQPFEYTAVLKLVNAPAPQTSQP